MEELADWERDLLREQAARDDAQAARDKADAALLRGAVAVMYRRSKRPRSFMLGVFAGVLNRWADSIEHGP